MKPLGFPAIRRLQDSKAFTQVFDHTDKKFFIAGILVLAKKNQLSYPRLGLVVSKKNIRLASRRNTVKRLIRESFRLHQAQLPAFDMVVLVRKEVATLNRKLLWQRLNQLWQNTI